jgi:hypothetical protein
MNGVVEVDVFAPDAGGPGAPLHLGRHGVRSGRRTDRVTAPRQPRRAGVDPYDQPTDRERGNSAVTARGTPERARR